MKFRHSIVFRLALFFTGLVVFSILLSGYLVYNKSSKVITEYSKNRIIYESELAEQAFYALLGEVSNDIAVIASSPTLQKYVLNPSMETTQEVDKLFHVILDNKESYFQIRFIGIENNGKEVIRFDKNNNLIIKSDDLQEKGDRDYFKEAINIKKGEFYFSKINLNEEYGVISLPQIPTLRAASPIFNATNRIIGIVIINVDLKKLYNSLDRISNAESQLYLINQDGEYLYALEKDKTFASQTEGIDNFYDDFNIEPEKVIEFKSNKEKEPINLNEDYLSYSKELSYFQGKRKIFLVSIIKQSAFLATAQTVRTDSLHTLLWVCLISILVSWMFVNFLSKKLNQITQAISNYDQGVPSDIPLPVNRKDEIGILAKTFSKMKVKIDQNVTKLNTALDKEKQAKQQRDEFLQNMSHEMRTPLNAILGLTQLLHKNEPTGGQIPIIEALERSANNLSGLVYDVLDHRKLVEGTLTIQYQPTNIASLLKDIYSSYQFDALQKELVFKINIQDALENNTYLTDPLRLSQIVTNLVVNAIKFTNKGEINLFANVVNDKTTLLEIKITDTGIGILPENIEKINDRYFQESENLSGRYGGYGLGLSIVKQLTALFGGSFKAKSKKEIGSEFSVKLPIISTELNQRKITGKIEVYRVPKLSHSYNILHIEDDASTLELMKHIFNDENIVLKQVSKLEDVVTYLNENSPNIIFSDLLLNDVSLKSNLLEWAKSKKINCPLIVISALEPDEIKAISPIYFQKPFNIDTLKDYTYKFLGANEFVSPDYSNIYSNYDNDAAKIVKVLTMLTEEFDTYVNRINSAVANNNQSEWEAISHKLIAHINNLNLTSLLEVLPEKVNTVLPKDLQKIQDTFAFYLCCFRVERHINLKD